MPTTTKDKQKVLEYHPMLLNKSNWPPAKDRFNFIMTPQVTPLMAAPPLNLPMTPIRPNPHNTSTPMKVGTPSMKVSDDNFNLIYYSL